MANVNELVLLTKKAALDAVEAAKPARVLFGKVESVAPLVIGVDQKMKLTKEFLVLSGAVSEQTGQITLDGQKKEVILHNGLKAGESVILLRQQGGDTFVVLDRMVKP